MDFIFVPTLNLIFQSENFEIKCKGLARIACRIKDVDFSGFYIFYMFSCDSA